MKIRGLPARMSAQMAEGKDAQIPAGPPRQAAAKPREAKGMSEKTHPDDEPGSTESPAQPHDVKDKAGAAFAGKIQRIASEPKKGARLIARTFTANCAAAAGPTVTSWPSPTNCSAA